MITWIRTEQTPELKPFAGYEIAGHQYWLEDELAMPGKVLYTTAPANNPGVSGVIVALTLSHLAADWKNSQEIGWNGWTNLEISWAVIMHRAHHGINPEMFFLAPPRLQVWWDRELVQYANWWNSSKEDPSRLPPLDRVTRYFGNACPYPPDGKFIGATSVTTWFEWSTDFQRGPRGTEFRHYNALVSHSPRFPIAAYLVAYALTLMERP